VIQQEGGYNLEFGDSGQRMVVENFISAPFIDNDGQLSTLDALLDLLKYK